VLGLLGTGEQEAPAADAAAQTEGLRLDNDSSA
jgi:hypothetical protein